MNLQDTIEWFEDLKKQKAKEMFMGKCISCGKKVSNG